MTQRIVLFSDIHANLAAFESVLRDIDARNRDGPSDAIYCLGDIGGYAASPNEVQDLLMARGYATVAGNYDENVGFDRDNCGCRYVDAFDIKMSDISFTWTREHTTREHKAWLRKLHHEIRLKVAGQRVLLCHGSPRSNTEYLFINRSDGYLRQFTHGGRYDARADVVCFGHTHVPYHREVNGVHFINTGSVGRPKDGRPEAGYCILSVNADSVDAEEVRVTYDVEDTCTRLLEAGLPEYFAHYLRAGGIVEPSPATVR